MSVLNQFVKGGSLFASNGAEKGKMVNVRFGVFNYGGKAAPAPGLIMDIHTDDGEVSENNFWSCGKASDWKPSDDGKKLIPIGKAQSLVENSNVALFLTSLFDSGFDPSKLDGDDITVLEGLDAEWERKAQNRKGMKNEEQNVLLVTALIESGGNTKSGNAQSAGDETSEWATGKLIVLLSQNPDGLKKTEILQKMIMAATAEKQNSGAIGRLFGNDEFLKSGSAWKYENGVAKPLS